MCDEYAATSLYEDTGIAERRFVRPQYQQVEEVHFSTVFERRRGLHFEFSSRKSFRGIDLDTTSPWQEYGLASNMRETYVWEGIQGESQQVESLYRAMKNLSIPSIHASTCLPFLLLRLPPFASYLKDARDIHLEGEDTLEGSPCYLLVGTDLEERPLRLWIDQITFRLRKIVFTIDGAQDALFEEEITFAPVSPREAQEALFERPR